MYVMLDSYFLLSNSNFHMTFICNTLHNIYTIFSLLSLYFMYTNKDEIYLELFVSHIFVPQ